MIIMLKLRVRSRSPAPLLALGLAKLTLPLLLWPQSAAVAAPLALPLLAPLQLAAVPVASAGSPALALAQTEGELGTPVLRSAIFIAGEANSRPVQPLSRLSLWQRRALF